jgi:predicted dehydrogenase
LRLAAIGCALGRSRYGGALAAPESAWRVTLLADADTRLAKVWSRELGGKIPVAEQIETLLEHRDAFDALLIASGPSERAEHLRMALEAEIPVLFETPPALTLDATRALLFHLLDHLDSILLPSLPRRFDPAIQAFTRQVTSGDLGALRQIRCDWNLPINSLEETAEGRNRLEFASANRGRTDRRSLPSLAGGSDFGQCGH